MSDLNQENNDSAVIAGNKDVYMNRDSIKKSRGRISGSASQKKHSLSPARQKKILDIKKKIAEGKYDFEEQLDVALDRLLEKLIG